MTGSLALPALELLLRMSPLAAAQSFLFAAGSGELSRFCSAVDAGRVALPTVAALLGNGLLAFALNIASFQTNRLAGALTITVCANVKQCLTILLGILLFDVQVAALNGVGMALALIGAAWYSVVELRMKKGSAARRTGSLSVLMEPVVASPVPEVGLLGRM